MMKLKEILTKGKDQNFYSETEKICYFFYDKAYCNWFINRYVSYLNHLTAFYIIHFFSHQKYVVGVIRDSLYLTTFKTKTFIEFHAFMSLF